MNNTIIRDIKVRRFIMKVTRVLFGIGVGVAAGFAVSLRNRDDQSVKK